MMRYLIYSGVFILFCIGLISCDQIFQANHLSENEELEKNLQEKLKVMVVERDLNQKMKGDDNFSALSENVAGRLFRYPAEEKRWLEMVSDTAYARDVLAGEETFISDAEDGETWNVEFELPDSTSIFGSPIEFHESYNNQENCFVSVGFISCGSRSILILWYVEVQGESSGEWDIHFINNETVYETKRFYLKPQIPPGKVPAGSAFNQGTYSTQHYDGICKGPLKPNGKPEPVPCDDTYTDPFTIQAKGCYLTAGAMILAYHGVDVSVTELNTWLNENDGYWFGDVIPDKIAEFAQKAKGINISYLGPSKTKDSDRLNNIMFKYGPQMIGTKLTSKNYPTHWVTATGYNLAETTLLINDPSGGTVTTIADRYGNRWSHIRAFSGPEFVVTNNSGITIRFHSPGELVLTDPQERRVGFDPISATSYDEVPQAGYGIQGLTDDSDPDPDLDNDPSLYHEIDVRQPADGEYRLEVIGTGTGEYSLGIITIGSDFDDVINDFRDVSISPGVIHAYQFSFSKDAGSQTKVEGGFDGKGQRPTDVNKFLTFASPIESQTDLPQGTTTVAVHLFYGDSTIPETFSAEWNRSDVSARFNPQPGTNEIVNLNLAPGRNVLVLSVDGQLPNRIATDTDRLVFKVE